MADSRPNILFILSDDHGVGSIGAYGDSMVPTPNIDSLAKEGAIFLNNTTSCALCGHSRATIITGQHASRHGVISLKESFDNSRWTFSQRLCSRRVIAQPSSEMHLKSRPEGFDTMAVNGGYGGQGEYYNPFFTDSKGENTTIHGHSTEIIADLAIDQLTKGKKSEQPFFVSVHFKAPHGRWEPSPETLLLFSDCRRSVNPSFPVRRQKHLFSSISP